ncbi:hypothetical protein LOK49_LG13G01714 [Camellia lanceoleosa]|uniref:Uncharacterized protein n=1 Tax=Camellia lanceoleosa TaxID=1840588 RepID=A0ACC0FJV5_9ERIC|nr:hypothetical protein LOK49_LG13G01714 [Camellia lanceoleosa]
MMDARVTFYFVRGSKITAMRQRSPASVQCLWLHCQHSGYNLQIKATKIKYLRVKGGVLLFLQWNDELLQSKLCTCVLAEFQLEMKCAVLWRLQPFFFRF